MKVHLFFGLLLAEVIFIALFFTLPRRQALIPLSASYLAQTYQTIVPSPTPTTPPLTPTPAPLTFVQLNSLYGPCARVPTLMYHHIQDLVVAKAEGHPGLAVSPEYFASQLKYLKDHGYNAIKIIDLLNFFDHSSALPAKPVLLTFDDGYADFYSHAYPLLQQNNLSAVMFLPTGLVNNPGYLTWGNIGSMSGSGFVYFANHTWSHHQLNTTTDVVNHELTTADTQLSDHHQDPSKIFAYPYGITSKNAISELNSLNYQLAFTTRPGSILCRGQRLSLPRVRVGNSSLSRLGL